MPSSTSPLPADLNPRSFPVQNTCCTRFECSRATTHRQRARGAGCAADRAGARRHAGSASSAYRPRRPADDAPCGGGVFLRAEAEVLLFPAWDCLPYDRVSPHRDIVARRLATLTRLRASAGADELLVTTVSALMQRVLPGEALSGRTLDREAGRPSGRGAPDRLSPTTAICGSKRSASPAVRRAALAGRLSAGCRAALAPGLFRR